MYAMQDEDTRFSVRCAACDLLYTRTVTQAEAVHLAATEECPYCAWEDFPF